MRIIRPLRTSQMASHHNSGVFVEQPRQSWQESSDAAIIDNDASVQRNVGVNSEKYDLTVTVKVGTEGSKTHYLERRTHVGGQVDKSVGVTPLVVVPRAHLDLVAQHANQSRIHD